MLTKTIPSVGTPRVLSTHNMFVTSKQTADFLGIEEAEVDQIAEAGHLQIFLDGPNKVYKSEQVELLASKLGPTLPPEIRKEKDTTGTINLAIWAICGLVAFVGIFSRRLYLLEFVVPAVALVGFVTFGIVIWQSQKRKEAERLRKRMQAETDTVLAQAERLERLNSMMK